MLGSSENDDDVLTDRRARSSADGFQAYFRLYVAQQCIRLSDEGAEDALYDSLPIRRFARIDFAREAALDATTLLKFHRRLEKNNLTKTIFEIINGHLANKGLLLKEGTTVDATIIAAPSSVKNKKKERAPAMHQAKKGNPHGMPFSQLNFWGGLR